MKWNRYKRYTASNGWVPERPTHWVPSRLRYVTSLNPTPATALESLEVSFLPMEAVGDDGSLDRSRTIEGGVAGPSYSYFAEGDVSIAKVTPCFENGKGAVMRGLVRGHAFGSSELTNLRPGTSVDADFLYAMTVSHAFRSAGAATMTGAGGLKRVSNDFFRNLEFGLPSLAEQRQIVQFLSGQTARIDTLIAKQERLIELLQEKRQALITRVVTRGLDVTVPMKDSGVEWLGEVPVHWDIKRIKHVVSSIEQGWSPECENRPADNGEWGVLKVGCVNGSVFNALENKALPVWLDPVPALTLKAGDVLVSRANTRELVGSCAVVIQDEPQLMLCDKLYRLAANDAVVPRYLALVVATFGRREVELAATGASASMVNVGQGVIMNLLFPLPKVREQLEILEFLRVRLDAIDVLRAKIEEATERSEEHRSALISAAVTGEIDVRHAA